MRLAETLAAYERGEINVLINAMLLAEGWNSPRATVCMHLAPTASRRVYQQRIGRIMRIHPRKEAGIVVDFVPKAATHNERVISLHSLLDADFYREGARVTPAPRRRIQRRAKRQARRRRRGSSRHARRPPPPRRDPARVAARRPEVPGRGRAALLGVDRRAQHPLRGADRVRREADAGPRHEGGARAVPDHVRRREPEPPPAADGARRPCLDARRAGRLRRPRHARQLSAAVGEGPDGRDQDPAARDRRGQRGRAGADPRALDVAACAGRAESPGPQGEPGVPGGEAAARRARELTRPPARGERGEARQRRARAAEARRRGAARVGRGVHAARDEAARSRARAARADPGGRDGAVREPAAAEDPADAQAPTPAPEEEVRGRSAATAGSRAAARHRTAARLRRTPRPSRSSNRRLSRRPPRAVRAAAACRRRLPARARAGSASARRRSRRRSGGSPRPRSPPSAARAPRRTPRSRGPMQPPR